jgi:long-chain fatty acid transport protein
MSYLTFENYKTPLDAAFPTGRQYIRTQLEGDDFNCGYELATQYKVTDDLKLGIVYRSRINHRVEGDFETSGNIDPDFQNYMYQQGVLVGIPPSGDADAKLVLPASVTFGANYDFTEKFRGGASLTWTEWSTINHIDFNLPAPSSRTQMLNWHDAWRLGFGFEYDLTDAFTGRIGYTFDWDPSAEAHGTTMLPPGDRHIIGFGASYKFFEDWRIDLGYSFILMESETRMVEGHRFQCDNSYSHIISASVAYTF